MDVSVLLMVGLEKDLFGSTRMEALEDILFK